MENLLKEVCRISEKYINRELLSGEYYNIFQVIKMKKEFEQLILGNNEYIRNISTLKKAIELSEISLQKQFWNSLRKKMEGKGYKVAPTPKNSNYIIASDDMVENYYRNNRDNHYGFEFKIGDYKDSDILYAVRMHTPVKCGFLARKKILRIP